MTRGSRRRVTREDRTAFHEAGHAVAHFYRERAVTPKFVTIVPSVDGDGNPDTLGSVVCHPLSAKFKEQLETARLEGSLDRVYDNVVCLLAGTVAVKKLSGRYDNAGARSDLEKAMDFASTVSPDTKGTELLLEWLRHETETLVQGNWWAVEAVARALLVEKTMKWRLVKEVIRAELARH